MNASGAIRAEIIRVSFHTGRISQIGTWPDFTAGGLAPQKSQFGLSPNSPYVAFFHHHSKKSDHDTKRSKKPRTYDPFDIEHGSFIDIDIRELEKKRTRVGYRIKRMLTVFPFRDPTWLVATTFVIGSIDFVINGFFGLLPLVAPSTDFETNATFAIPSTLLIGAGLFFVAGAVDIFGAFNADRGVTEICDNPENGNTKKPRHRPALLGSESWVWIPTSKEFTDLLSKSKPFQAAFIQSIAIVLFTFSAIAGTPGVLDPTSKIFPTLIFGPQVIGGFMFFIANAGLTVWCEQDSWWRPKPLSAGWQAVFQSSLGGVGFMMAGIFLYKGEILASSVSALAGSWLFLLGSLFGWYDIMEIC
jgi:hypothetical protein